APPPANVCPPPPPAAPAHGHDRKGPPMSTPATTSIPPLRQRPAWAALAKHHEAIRGRQLRKLFAEDPTRGERLTAEGAGLYLDYSKNRVVDETLALLVPLAEQSGLAQGIEAMFPGGHIHVS